MGQDMPNSTDDPLKRDFQCRVQSKLGKYRRLRLANQLTAQCLTLAALLLSFIATILVSTHFDLKLFGEIGLTTVLTGLPAVLLSINQSLGLTAKGLFFNSGAAKLETVLVDVMYKGLSVAEAADKYANVIEEMEEHWARIARANAGKAGEHPRLHSRDGPG
jgi:hypothetical protein